MSHKATLTYQVVKEFRATPISGQPRLFKVGEQIRAAEMYPFHDEALRRGYVVIVPDKKKPKT